MWNFIRALTGALFLGLFAVPAAHAQWAPATGVNGCGSTVVAHGPGATLTIDQNTGILCSTGGTGTSGSVTPSGTLGTQFQSVQGGGEGAIPITSQNVGSPNFNLNQATPTTTATLIAAARSGRNAITIENLGTTPVYIGGSGVTTSTGALLVGTVGASLTIPTTAAVYGITASGSQAVAYIETY